MKKWPKQCFLKNQLEAKGNTLFLILVFSYILPEYETHNTTLSIKIYKTCVSQGLIWRKREVFMTSTVPKVINAPKCTENYICDRVLINLYRMLKHVITLLLFFFGGMKSVSMEIHWEYSNEVLFMS